MQGAANRIPVFAYTKMHANPPITTVTEQCWWPDANEDPYHIHEYNDRRIKYHFARPKSCHFADHSRKNKVSKPRPNTAFSPSTTTMSVTGERYVTTTSPTVTSTPSTSTHSSPGMMSTLNPDSKNETLERSSTPDQLLMHEVYDIYSQSLSTPNLLRRPVTEMSKRSTNDEFPTCEDFRQSAMEFLLQKLDLGIEDEFKPTVVEPVKPTPQPKLAIDITLCDSAGTLLGMKEEPLWDNSATSNPSDVIQNKSNTKNNCAMSVCQHKEEENLRPKSRSRKKSASKPTKKRPILKKKLEASKILVDYQSTEHCISETTKFTETEKQDKRCKDPDEIESQMSHLGLAKPLEDNDLRCLLRQKSCPNIRLPVKPTEERECDISKKKGEENESKPKGRRIPIQIISDPFKCIGGKNDEKVLKPERKKRPLSGMPRPNSTWCQYGFHDGRMSSIA